MMLYELTKYVDTDIKFLLGEFSLSLIGNRAIAVKNFEKILNYTNSNVLFSAKNKEVVIVGENFTIAEMGAHDAIITGKIHNIEFKS